MMALATASALVEEEERSFDVLILLKGGLSDKLKVPEGVSILANDLDSMLSGKSDRGKQFGVAHTRIFAPAALAGQYSRLLYIDADVAAFGPVTPLFKLDMLGLPLAAVEGMMDETAPLHAIDLKSYKDNLGISDGRVFNSGVLLIDTAEWASIDHPRTMADYKAMREKASAPRTGLYGDQDYLNFAMCGRWLGLSPRWNYQTIFLRYALDEAIDPVLVHYTGSRRPWDAKTFPYGERHVQYYRERLRDIGYTSPLRPGTLRRVVTDSLRQMIHGLGTPTLHRMFDEWKTMRQVLKDAVQRRIESGQYADVEQGISQLDLASSTWGDMSIKDVRYYRGQVRIANSLNACGPGY